MPTIRYTGLTLIKESRSPKMRIKALAEILGFTILGCLADCLYAVLCALRLISTVRPASDYKVRLTFQWFFTLLIVTKPSDVEHISDAELLKKLCTDGPVNPLSKEYGVELFDDSIRRLSPGTVAKKVPSYVDPGPPSETLTLDLVFENTTIPVPRARRSLRLEEWAIDFTVMNFVPGRQLRYVWPTLSLFAKLRVAFTIRSYIRQLRAIRHPRALIPGPVADGKRARDHKCYMMVGALDRLRRPTPSRTAFSEWWNERYDVSLKMTPKFLEEYPWGPFDDSAPLVLTHCDLNMRNILVGDDGRLYLLDWSMGGFYPPWFEYVNWKDLHRFWVHCEEDISGCTDWLWGLLVPFMSCGPYRRQEMWYLRVSPALC